MDGACRGWKSTLHWRRQRSYWLNDRWIDAVCCCCSDGDGHGFGDQLSADVQRQWRQLHRSDTQQHRIHTNCTVSLAAPAATSFVISFSVVFLFWKHCVLGSLKTNFSSASRNPRLLRNACCDNRVLLFVIMPCATPACLARWNCFILSFTVPPFWFSRKKHRLSFWEQPHRPCK